MLQTVQSVLGFCDAVCIMAWFLWGNQSKKWVEPSALRIRLQIILQSATPLFWGRCNRVCVWQPFFRVLYPTVFVRQCVPVVLRRPAWKCVSRALSNRFLFPDNRFWWFQAFFGL